MLNSTGLNWPNRKLIPIVFAIQKETTKKQNTHIHKGTLLKLNKHMWTNCLDTRYQTG